MELTKKEKKFTCSINADEKIHACLEALKIIVVNVN